MLLLEQNIIKKEQIEINNVTELNVDNNCREYKLKAI